MDEARPDALEGQAGVRNDLSAGDAPPRMLALAARQKLNLPLLPKAPLRPPQTAPASTPAPKPAFPLPAPLPTQSGPLGLRFDFNGGCRVMFPKANIPGACGSRSRYRQHHLSDRDEADGSIAASVIRTVADRYLAAGHKVFSHDYAAKIASADPVPARNARRHHRLVPLCGKVQGQAWLPADLRDGQTADSAVSRCLSGYRLYRACGVQAEQFYATYNIGLFFDDKACVRQPCDFRLVGLHRTAGYILGVDPTEEPPRLASDDSRPIAEPYVCIAVQSTTQAKYWNNPNGWHEVRLPEEKGYRVICVDRSRCMAPACLEPHPARRRGPDRPFLPRERAMA